MNEIVTKTMEVAASAINSHFERSSAEISAAVWYKGIENSDYRIYIKSEFLLNTKKTKQTVYVSYDVNTDTFSIVGETFSYAQPRSWIKSQNKKLQGLYAYLLEILERKGEMEDFLMKC